VGVVGQRDDQVRGHGGAFDQRAGVRQGDDALAGGELGHGAFDDGAHALVARAARRERVGRRRQRAVLELQVTATHGQVVQAREHLSGCKGGHRDVNQAQLLGANELHGLHAASVLRSTIA
jgi:hypothetical protein